MNPYKLIVAVQGEYNRLNTNITSSKQRLIHQRLMSVISLQTHQFYDLRNSYKVQNINKLYTNRMPLLLQHNGI